MKKHTLLLVLIIGFSLTACEGIELPSGIPSPQATFEWCYLSPFLVLIGYLTIVSFLKMKFSGITNK